MEPIQTTKWTPWFNANGLPAVIGKKVRHLINVLNSDLVDISLLQAHLSDGIPDEAGAIREFSWKIILGYLPEQRSLWDQRAAKQTQTYNEFVRLFLPQEKFEDYPILLRKGHARYNELESDFSLWEQIEKDTSRTHAQFSFFAMESKQIMIPYLTSARREKFKQINGESEANYKEFLGDKAKQRKCYRYDYMTRILYIYSKLNPRIQYVQGMNQILAPIFYLVNCNKPPTAIEEASCFFMFNNAISDVIELHIKDLDKSENGIYGKLQQVNNMLVVIQPRIWSRLEQLKIDPFFYCFRWITLLYAQDFALFDTLRIWESIFSSKSRLDFINFFAISIIISAKEIILTQQFTFVLEYLQDIRDHIDVNEIISIANSLYLQFVRYDFKCEAKKVKLALERKEAKAAKKSEKGGFLKSLNSFMGRMME